jgi:poly [ADP-ribose] polymerase
MVLDGNKVIVPQGEPADQLEFVDKSSFDQSEYLIYREDQCRIRYLVKILFDY